MSAPPSESNTTATEPPPPQQPEPSPPVSGGTDPAATSSSKPEPAAEPTSQATSNNNETSDGKKHSEEQPTTSKEPAAASGPRPPSQRAPKESSRSANRQKKDAPTSSSSSPSKATAPREAHESSTKESHQQTDIHQGGSSGVVVRPDGRKVVERPSDHLWQPRKRPATSEGAGDASEASPSPSKHPKVTGCSPRIAALEVKPHVPLPPIQPVKKLTAEQQERLTQSVYEAARKRNETALQKLQERYMAIPVKEVVKSEEEINEVSYRLSVQETNVRRSRQEKLYDKYLSRGSPPRRTTSAEGRVVLVTRLHDASVKHQREVTEELDRLYTPRLDSKRLSPEEIKKLAEKLSSPRK